MRNAIKPFVKGANAISKAERATGGGEKIGKWQTEFDLNAINPLTPLFRTIEGKDHTMFVIDTDVKILTPYAKQLNTKEQQRKMILTAVMKFWEEWDKNHPDISFYDYVSGKGMYRVQKYNKAVSKLVFLPVLWDDDNVNGLFKKNEGFSLYYPKNKEGKKSKRHQGICKKFTYKSVEYLIIIDTVLYKRGGHIFRVPYSAYQKFGYKTFYCVPVVKQNGAYNVEETIKQTELGNIQVAPIVVPPFQFIDYITRSMDTEDIEELSRKVQRVGTIKEFKKPLIYYKITCPEPHDLLDEKQEKKVDEMFKLISSNDPEKTPPCIYNALHAGGHHKNVVLLRYLASMKYDYYSHNKNYSPDDLAMFFRFRINDEEDNLPQNKNKLFTSIRAYLGNPEEPDKPPSCSKMQDIHSDFYFCDPAKDAPKCGRSYCLRKKPSPVIVQALTEAQEERDFDVITHRVSQMLQQPHKHFEAIKTTRAGLTTTLIRVATYMKKRTLVLVPTNRIAEEVFSSAMRIIYEQYGERINGAVLSSNKNSCLKLRFQITDLKNKKKEEPNWGPTPEVEWLNMPFHTKPSCIVTKETGQKVECPYYRETFVFPHREEDGTPMPIWKSDDSQYQQYQQKQGYCAYQTVMQRIYDYDVLFMTYDKMSALAKNNEPESKALLNMIFDAFDVVFMDEISNLVQSSPLAITVYDESYYDANDNKTTINSRNFIQNLHEEFNRLDGPPNPNTHVSFNTNQMKTIDKLRLIKEKFCLHYEKFVMTKKFDGELDKVYCEKVENVLLKNGPEELEEFRDNFFAYLSVISSFVKRTNEPLPNIIKMLQLLQSDVWWLQNTPTIDKKINACFVTSPKIRKVTGFVTEMHNRGKQIIVTDATMPLAKPSDVFGLDFERFNVGDPRNTCDKQLIVPSNKVINIRTLLSKTKATGKYDDLEDLKQFIKNVCKQHGTQNVLLIVSNIFTFNMMWDLKKKEEIPQVAVTYYRSDETIGVAKEERVMVTICPPNPPKNSSLWLANYYQEQGMFVGMDIEELSGRLEIMNAHQTFYQTIGRAKDPMAKDFSVVYNWGMSYNEVMKTIKMDDDVPMPHIAKTNKLITKEEMLVIGKVWKKFGYLVDYRFNKLLKYLDKHNYLLVSNAHNIVKKNRNERVAEPKKFIQEIMVAKDLLEYFGISLVKHDRLDDLMFIKDTGQ